MRKEKRVPPFFRAISGACAFRQAIRVWPHSEIFAGRRPAKMLVGELPKPAGLLDKVSRSPCCQRPGAIAPGPYDPARPCGRADDQYLP